MNESVAEFGDLDRAFLGQSRWGRTIARRLVLGKLQELQEGCLILVEDGEEMAFGAEGAQPSARVEVLDSRFYGKLAFGGTVGAGESYMAGHWRAEDLTALVRLLVRNRDCMNNLEGGAARLAMAALRIYHRLRRNTAEGSQRNIGAHYDLGNEFFATFLDRAKMYSCAIFETPEQSLDEASEAKLERICRKLDLGPQDHLLEIGTGWGGMAIHAARHYGCRVTTTTISPAQFAFASRAVDEAGLGDRIQVLRQDYRELEGQFDKLVSIEMIEAVGLDFLDTFFAQCSRLLAPHGLMLLQAITMADRYFDQASRSVDFIQRYIFPGSALPSVGAMAASTARSTDLTAVHLEDIGLHYATTLRLWRERFFANLETIRGQGFSERFVRMWEFYLCYCEGGFLERSVSDVQLLLAKPRSRRLPVLGTLPRQSSPG